MSRLSPFHGAMTALLLAAVLFLAFLPVLGSEQPVAAVKQADVMDVSSPASPHWTEGERAAQRRAGTDLYREVKAAISRGDRRFFVPAGNYRFDGAEGGGFVLENVRGFELEASGATFWFGAGLGLRLRHCENVTIRGLVVDTDPLPWWQGTIVAIDPVRKSMDMVLDEGYALPAAADLKVPHRVLLFDQESRLELFLLDEQARELSLPGGNRVRVERFARDTPFVNPMVPRVPRLGDKLVINNERLKGGNVFSQYCSGLIFENVTLHGSGSFALHEFAGKGGNTYRNCRIVRRPGTNRLLASRGDAFHSSAMEKGPLIEGCEFSFAGDDLLAVQGFFSLIMSRNGARELLIASPYGPGMRVGSTIQVSRFPDGATLGDARIAVMEEVANGNLIEAAERLQERALAERQIRIRKLSEVKVYRLQVDRDLPGGEFDLVGCADYSGAGAVIRNNHLHDGHVRGVLIKSHDTIVENNVVERIGHGGIVFEAELYWLEGPFNARAKITNNRLVDIGGGALDRKGISVTIAAIQVGNYFGQRLFPRLLTAGNQNTDIEISGNEIVRPVTFPIWIRNADRVIIRGNRINAPFAGGALPMMLDMSGLLPPAAKPGDEELRALREPYFGVLLQNVSHESVGGNQIINAPPFYKSELGIITVRATP